MMTTDKIMTHTDKTMTKDKTVHGYPHRQDSTGYNTDQTVTNIHKTVTNTEDSDKQTKQ